MNILLKSLFFVVFVTSASANGEKEIALTFDDAPLSDSLHFKLQTRTKTLIEQLKKLKVERVMIFANPCRHDPEISIPILKQWNDAGHILANHSCSHRDLDKVPVSDYLNDVARADQLLADLLPKNQKFFRFPYLHEGKTIFDRDAVRDWLQNNHYRNGHVSIDNDEWRFHSKLNLAKEAGKPIDYESVGKVYVEHLIGALEFYDSLAIEALGRRPKHVLLLHEIDSSVLFIEQLVNALRKNGWTIIDPIVAYEDPVYRASPKSLYSNNGLIAQLADEKGLGRRAYVDSLRESLDNVLRLTK